MTQRHVEMSSLKTTSLKEDTNHQIVLDIDENFSIIVKQYRREVYVLIRSGSKYLKLPLNIFEAMCNSQISVAYSKAILEGITEGLCCYCGLQFVSEVECLEHENNEHVCNKKVTYRFHQNVFESERFNPCFTD